MKAKNLRKLLVGFSAMFMLVCFSSHSNSSVDVDAVDLNPLETICWSQIGGSDSYGHLIIHLTDNDFVSSSSTSYGYASYGKKLEALNLKDKILINGSTLSWSNFNEAGFKFSNEIYTNMFSPNDGTFSIGINVQSGHSISEINSVKLLKGIEIPSKSYLDGLSTDVYTIFDNVESVRDTCNYGWATYADVKVWNVATVENTYLGLKLSYSDLPTEFKDGSVGDSRCNYNSNIEINNGSIKMSSSTYGLFNYGSINDCIWVQTTSNTSAANSVTIPANTTFRMYANVSKNPGWPVYFRVKESHTFTKDSGNHWIPFFEDIETSVDSISQTSINNEWPAFKLTISDYYTARQANFGVYFGDQHNLWDNIEIIDSSLNSHKAKDVFENFSTIFCFGGTNINTVGLNSITGYKTAGSLTKIFIPKGTEFPSYEYLNNPNTIQPKRYVTNEDLSFSYVSNGIWKKILKTSIESISWNSDGYLAIKLSNSDYSDANETGIYEKTLCDFYNKIDLSSIGLNFNASCYSLWNYTDLGNDFASSVAPKCDGTITTGVVVIPEDTTFPSYAYSKGLTQSGVVFETEKDIAFRFNGSSFINVTEGWSIDNKVISMGTHGSSTPGSNDVSLDFYTEKFDWPTTITDLDCNTLCPGKYSNSFNTLTKIHVYDSNDNELAITSEFFVNVWGKTNLFSIRLYNAGSVMKNVCSILIEKGCEFPTYAGLYVDNTNNKISDYSKYVTTKDIKYAFDYSLKTFTEISTFKEIETSVIAVQENNKQEQNSFLTLFLSESDYGTNSMTDLTSINLEKLKELNFADYITVNGVKISDMSCFNDVEMFMNLFSNNGTFSFRTTGNNTGCYYIFDKNRYDTGDLINYEICIARGCQFPSYQYISGLTNKKTCYTVKNDIRFAWVDNCYVLEDNSFVEPSISSTEIVDISGYQNSESNIINFVLTNNDWPTKEVIKNIDISSSLSCYSLVNHVVITDINENKTNINSNKVLINANENETGNPTIGLSSPIPLSQIKKVEIVKGAMFPSYSNYINSNRSWYFTNETQVFYSSKDGLFYCGDNLTAEKYADEFNLAFYNVCHNYNGSDNNKDKLENKFYAFKNLYNEKLSSSERNLLTNASSNSSILKMFQTYNFVVSKYGLENFLNSPYISNSSNIYNNMLDSSSLTYIVIAVSVCSIGILSLLILKKRKGN